MESEIYDHSYTGKQLQIIEVAERLFAEHGFDGTSVRDIATEAGVNVAMISYYFGSKEKLLLAVFNHRVSAGRLVLEHLAGDKDMSPLDKIDALVDGMVDRMLKHGNFHRVMLRAQLTTDHEDVLSIMTETKAKNLALVNQIIYEGQQKKIFVSGVDAAMLMMTVVGTVYQAATGCSYMRIIQQSGTWDASQPDILNTRLKSHLKHVLKAALTYEG
jgi:AcrR family transcriptional regulator